MGQKAISTIKLTDTLSLSECKDGYWLYDYTQGWNIASRAKTEHEAFAQALGYYQRRLSEVEKRYKVLSNSVEDFISSIQEENEKD